jgi:hypothetical protein
MSIVVSNVVVRTENGVPIYGATMGYTELEYKPFFAGGVMVTGILDGDEDVKIPVVYNGEPVRAVMIEDEKQWESVQRVKMYAGCDITYKTLEILAKKHIWVRFYGTQQQFDKLFPTPVAPEFIQEWGYGYTPEEIKKLKSRLHYSLEQ